jgi:hypothetical protein
MPERKAADVERALLEKGMEPDENHHHMFRKRVDGVTHLVTRVSHGSKKGEIGDTIGKLMGAQCCLQLKEFWELIDCTLSEDAWDALVAERCSAGKNPFMGF